jgi:hypothetical protein
MPANNQWKKATIPFFDLKIGGSCEGTYLECKKVGERINKETGEVTDRLMVVMVKEDGEKFQLNYTAGLRNALLNSDVKKGDYIRIDRLEKVPMRGKPGEVNQYDIFVRG